MRYSQFTLRPFNANSLSPEDSIENLTEQLSVTGTAVREEEKLSLNYLLAGDWTRVQLGEPTLLTQATTPPERKDRLWEQTCFEFFVAPGEQPPTHQRPYWEFNLSPRGHWNVFSLTGYREGLKEELSITALPFELHTSDAGLHLAVSLSIDALVPVDRPVQLGVSMVMLLVDEASKVHETFWAIAHPGPEADFHHPDSFILSL